MTRLIKHVLLIPVVCGIAAPLLTQETRAEVATCHVTTTSGEVQGLDTGPTCSFLGIPYAAPPTGALRWKPPQPAASWATPVPAITSPPNCPNVNNGPPAGNENCLMLNVWVRNPLPATPAPVIVWLHTGGFAAASANFQGNNGRRLTEETGVIVVAPNYRLGPFGFLVHNALAAEDPARPVSGNYGLLDQRAALKWVRDNIAAFGGDPNNVTLAGTSAGGDSVGLHLVSPATSGLFHRAVIQSGTPTIRWPGHTDAAAQGDRLAMALGCVDPQTVVSCMRSKTPAAVLTALPMASMAVGEPPSTHVLWQPVVDGLEIPDQPRLLFQTGLFTRVPTIIGFTRDEAAGSFTTRTFPSGVTLAQYEAWLATEFGADAAAVGAQYPAGNYPTPFDALAQLAGDVQFVCEGRRLARALSDSQVPVFFYSYEYVIGDLSPDRVVHGVESSILFGNNYMPAQFPNHVLDANDLALHARMAEYWTRFAETGDPNSNASTVPHWPAFHDPVGQGRGSNLYLVLDSEIRMGKRLRENACDFWEPFFLRSILGKVPAGAGF